MNYPIFRLNQVLRRLDGHYLFGATDTKPNTLLSLAPGAVDEAEQFLQAHPVAGQRLERVARLIEGFETPYGLELLSTIHWLARADPELAGDEGACCLAVRRWSGRKAEQMRPEHIHLALVRLREEQFLPLGTAQLSA